MSKYALLINHELCWGCKTCEVACKQENNAAEGVKLISVSEDGPSVIDGQLNFVYRVNHCRHCDDPPCAEAPMMPSILTIKKASLKSATCAIIGSITD
jgi:Fe-S-cluster-containing dehydrogenase component